RVLPDNPTNILYTNWQKLIPTLMDLQLKYYAQTIGQGLEKTNKVISACTTLSCTQKKTNSLCLFF
ncbi:hypothetical protein EDB19DRAFT_1594184, partial [Suillus lakei]